MRALSASRLRVRLMLLVLLATAKETRYVNCAGAPLAYYTSLIRDVRERTERAMPQSHCFKVTELALTAQAQAIRLGAAVESSCRK